MAKHSKITSSVERKQRTREHVIADLSVNFVGRLALKCGYVVREEHPDYSLDLRLQTFDERRQPESEQVWLQLKATDCIRDYELKSEECFSYPIDTKDYRYWVDRAMMPVFLILYDAVLEEAYWLDITEYHERVQPSTTGKSIRVHIPRVNVLGIQTMWMMRQRKQRVFEEWKKTKQPRE